MGVIGTVSENRFGEAGIAREATNPVSVQKGIELFCHLPLL